MMTSKNFGNQSGREIVRRTRRGSRFLVFIMLMMMLLMTAHASPSDHAVLAFASSRGSGRGGFGGGAATSSSSKTTPKKKKKTKNILDELSTLPPPTKTTIKEDQNVPKLDKWGLPEPTLDDIFPPLPAGTELLPATKEDYTLTEIKEALKDHFPLQLDTFFDESGLEKESDLLSDRLPMKLRLLHVSPPILTIENFFTSQDCLDIESVIADDDDHSALKPFQVDSKTFALATSTRTSTSWFCYYQQVPILLAKCKHILGIDLPLMEEPQIVRYKLGQEFSWHYDEIPESQLPNGGQRLITVLVYLNTVPKEHGGGTVFRDLKDGIDINSNNNNNSNMLTMQPVQGSACLFFPAFANGRPDDRTLHKGQVILDNNDKKEAIEKRIIQMWIHQHPYTATVPPNNRQSDAIEAVDRISKELGYV